MTGISYKPIGIIRSPFETPEGTPIQPAGARGVEGTVEVLPEYSAGLKDLDGFSHIFLIYHFHRSKKSPLTVKPYMDHNLRGVFATRSPGRPNPIGLSLVRLVRVEGPVLHIQDVDIVDGTPLLDIKPYVPEFDFNEPIKIGWLEGPVGKVYTTRDDGRFKR